MDIKEFIITKLKNYKIKNIIVNNDVIFNINVSNIDINKLYQLLIDVKSIEDEIKLKIKLEFLENEISFTIKNINDVLWIK